MSLSRAFFLLFVSVSVARAADVAVSIRYLQPKGTSHAAIYLFDENGKLVRQLTQPGEDQDYAPIFSPDGKEIVFRRVHGEDETGKQFVVDRAGEKTRPIEGEPPAWFAGHTVAKEFGDANTLGEETEKPVREFPSADGALTLTLKTNPDDADHPLAFLREGKGPLQPLAEMPGFGIFWFATLDHGSPFFSTGKLRAVFIAGDHDSTLGTTTYALDVGRKQITELSKNGAEAYAWPGHAGFFVLASSRYEPLGDGRTVNCSYLDRYDETMKRTRFGHALGRYGGASVFVAGEAPFTLPYLHFTD